MGANGNFWDTAATWDELAARCREMAFDVSFPSVRQWKDGRAGAHAAGCFPVYTPQEILAAGGCLPVSLYGGRGQIEIDHADSRIQSFVCSVARSTLELGLAGRLGWLDGFVVPSICDVARNLSGVWQHNFDPSSLGTSAKPAFYLHLPQNVDSDAAAIYFRGELERLREWTTALTGTAVTDEALRAAIVTFDRNRALLDELYARRAARPDAWPASQVYSIAAAGNVLPREAHNALLERALALGDAAARPKRDAVRVALRGAFCEQPPLELLDVIEEAGCAVVDDDLQIGARFFPQPIAELPAFAGDPLGALAEAYLHRTVLTPVNNPGQRSRTADLLARCREKQVQGLIFASPKFCEPALYDAVLLRRAAEHAMLPVLEFEYEEKMSVFESVRMQAETFVESILFFS